MVFVCDVLHFGESVLIIFDQCLNYVNFDEIILFYHNVVSFKTLQMLSESASLFFR
jgi:hypothetical protein